MPEWIKVLAGSLALMIGASAPSLIVLGLKPSAFISPLLSSSAPPVGEAPSRMTKPEANQVRQKQNDHESFWQPAVDPLAVSTLVLALATIALAYVSWRAAKDTRRALILAQRPRIRVRNVFIGIPRIFDGRLFHPGQLIRGQFYIVNIGGTEAKLFEAHCEVYWESAGVHTLPMERPYEGKNPNVPVLSIILQPGQSTPMPFESDRQVDERESDQILEGRLLIYVLGFVAYIHQLGIRRRTAFCRTYDYTRRRFFAVCDPDYEHEE